MVEHGERDFTSARPSSIQAGVSALAIVPLLLLLAPLSPEQQDLRATYEELIEIDTSPETTRAAQAAAARLKRAGFPAEDIHIVGPHPDKQNLVARLRGKGERPPLLLLAHLDVVEARREDWSMEPFVLLERDGWFYGRGSIDDKAMAAMFIEIAIQLRRNPEKPDRDVILALTADEEGGDHNGVEWLLENRRDLVNAGLVINEGGGGRMRDGTYVFNGLQAAEKSYMTYVLEVRDKGGHSSVPRKENAIYRLAAVLGRIERHRFPVELNEVTRNFFARMAELETGATAADMRALLRDPPDERAAERLSEVAAYNATLRTTCVATRLSGGHADNALPQQAGATINCRILPGHGPEEVRSELVRLVGDGEVEVRAIEDDTSAPASPLDPGIVTNVEEVTKQMWPGVPVVATMGTGATDSRYFRRAGIAAYGISGIFADINDVRAHGKDERVGVRQFYEGYEFLKRLVDRLTH
jgi:acetylornithine deacetylase/succinyl-diaminopimelate desuccinylase-like protein